jgi:hypothetical protein
MKKKPATAKEEKRRIKKGREGNIKEKIKGVHGQ